MDKFTLDYIKTSRKFLEKRKLDYMASLFQNIKYIN